MMCAGLGREGEQGSEETRLEEENWSDGLTAVTAPLLATLEVLLGFDGYVLSPSSSLSPFPLLPQPL